MGRPGRIRLSSVSRWITRVERTVTEDVPGPPDDVRGFYTDLDNIKLVHPLVVSVRTVGRSETADGYVQTYRVGDRIPMGPLRLRTSYVARLYVPVTGDVLSEARQFPRVRLCSTVAFQPIEVGHPRRRADTDRSAAAAGVGDRSQGGRGAHRDACRYPAPLRTRTELDAADYVGKNPLPVKNPACQPCSPRHSSGRPSGCWAAACGPGHGAPIS